MPKISVIVPVYNVEKYLRQCLDSLVAQTFKDIEVIIIDNNSPDNSHLIIKEYVEKYPNFKTYKKIGGMLGGARNEGVKYASGDYLLFLDSDDWVHPTICQRLYETAQEKDYDIVACDAQKTDINGTHINTPKGGPAYDLIKPTHTRLDFLKASANIGQAWGKLIKRRIFTENNLLYPENSTFEDIALTYASVIFSDRIRYTKERLVFYRYVPTSLSNNKHLVHPISMFSNFEQMRVILLAKNVEPEVIEEFEYNLLKMICGGEAIGNGSIKRLDKHHFNEFSKKAAPFYNKLPSDFFKKRNLIFKLKYFFLRLSLKYNSHWLPKIARPVINAVGFFYYPLQSMFLPN